MSTNVNLHVGTRNQKFYYEMNGVKFDSVKGVKCLGASIASNLKFPQQCKDAVGEANRMLGFTNTNFSFKNKDVILPLYISLVRYHLEYPILVASSCKGHSKIRSCSAKGYEDDNIPTK